ncbi:MULTISPECIES: YjbF family lipoprotein [Idiomarina]|uniref:YjbF family lipoprotein n=1 Tax=Idiomarina TaxID=135575 RepID=UPI001389A3CB|nr:MULTISPECIES: YjbF family lipoprotein [Idiomarina]UUN12754.1 YjbF family lipoprotein [Idiomarina loihiensis]
MFNAAEAAQVDQATQTTATQTESLLDRLLGKNVSESIDLAFGAKEDIELTPEQAQALPYAASYIRLGDSPRSLVVLGEADNLVQGQNPDAIYAQRLQWFTNSNEIVETVQGRVQSLQNLKYSTVKAVWLAQASTELSYDVRQTSAFHTEHKPHFVTVRQSYRVVKSQREQSLAMPNGTTLHVLVTEERLYPLPNKNNSQNNSQYENEQPIATNEFYRDLASGRVVKSKQWLGAELGYFEMTEVQPFNGVGGPTQNWGYSALPAQPGFQDLKTQDGSDPTQYRQLRVKLTQPLTKQAAQQQTQLFSGLFFATVPALPAGQQSNSNPSQQATRSLRLNDIMTEFHRLGLEQVPYAPLTRLHSPKLDQWFAGRKAGMLVRLRMLEQTYKADGETQLAAQAAELTQAFQSWPLRATYIHGWSLGDARINQATNKALNLADAADSNSVIPSYELSLNPAPQTSSLQVGLATQLSDHEQVYVTDAHGQISLVPLQSYNSTAEQRALAHQPGALVLRSIADKDLPKGFRDVNYQLAMFLQHWDWAAASATASTKTTTQPDTTELAHAKH